MVTQSEETANKQIVEIFLLHHQPLLASIEYCFG